MRQDLASYVSDIDVSKRILEIGPLTNPVFSKREANVFYSDIRSTDKIKEFYANDPGVDTDAVVDIDFVIEGSYEKSLSHVDTFDYVVSSHVLEHMPRLIEHFQDVATILNENGRIYLFIPDHRYCFDHFRAPTSFAEAYYIHSQGIKAPPWRVFDHLVETVPLNAAGRFWSGGGIAAETLSRRRCFEDAVKGFNRVLEGDYVDAHFSVFTPKSFFLLIYNMVQARLFPFQCMAFYPTERNTFTFGAVFQVCPEMMREGRVATYELHKLTRLLDARDLLGE